ncbi:MAG TPA: histidine kinase [bacterium]|nr:histidine kinase [bacterium]
MKKRAIEIEDRFYAVLTKAGERSLEKTLQDSYEIGRAALEAGAGVLDLARAHQSAVDRIIDQLPPSEQRRFFALAQQVLRESLSSIELVQVGLRDAIASLHSEILERKRVEKEVLDISQKEQRRFGAELHDGLCQKLVGISMLLHSLLAKEKRAGPAREPDELEKIAQLLDESARQARDMAHGLFPVELQADSLMLSLKALAGRLSEANGIRCRFHCPESILIEDNNLATHLFRIVQEATSNSRKHGAADQIDILLLKKKGQIELSVRDNGPKELKLNGNSGIGIQIMKYRARMIEANLEFRRVEPRGTLLICTFPFSGDR